MSRPLKNSCQYYPHDSGMRNHPKVKSLRQHFKNGYAIWNMLLEFLTASDGNVFEKSEMEFNLMAGDFGFDAKEITEVVNYCIKLEMLFEREGFIYSESLDTNLNPVYVKRKRAKQLSEKQLRVLGKFASGEKEESLPVEQSEIKEPPKIIHVPPGVYNESNLSVKPEEPKPVKEPPKKPKKEKPISDKPFWQLWVDTWFDFHKENKKEEPSFKGQDPKYLEVIYLNIKKRTDGKNPEGWTEEFSVKAFRKFLNLAYADKWLHEHFLLKNLETNFDVIIQPRNEKDVAGVNGKIIAADKFSKSIQPESEKENV